jgi:hypothetical protein
MIVKDDSDNNRVQDVPQPHHHDQQQGQARKKPKKPQDLTTSLLRILMKCNDCKLEKSKLDCLVEELGGNCCMTPKVHPEIAGVGIEYWKEINNGLAVHLEKNVKKVLSPEETLTMNQTCKFARKATE